MHIFYLIIYNCNKIKTFISLNKEIFYYTICEYGALASCCESYILTSILFKKPIFSQFFVRATTNHIALIWNNFYEIYPKHIHYNYFDYLQSRELLFVFSIYKKI